MTHPGDRHALVLSGGGANGAYEVGVVKALFNGLSPATNYKPLEPEIFSGTSIGAYNAALMVSELTTGNSAVTEYMENIWLNTIPRDDNTGHNFVFRYRGDPFELFDPRFVLSNPTKPALQLAGDITFFARDLYRRSVNLFLSRGDVTERVLKLVDLSTIISNEPEHRLIRETIQFANIRESKKKLKIAVTNWRTGALKEFENKDMSDEAGPEIILASTAVPGVFPQVEIAGEYYADGGTVMNTPLAPAIRAGADVIHIIYLDSEVKDIPLLTVRNTIDTISRMFVIQFAAAIDRDIEIARRINRGIEILEQAAQGAGLSGSDLGAFLYVAERVTRDPTAYRKITIHRYQPRDVLGGILGLLEFDRDRVSELISRGFQEAIAHDCVVNKCILPT